MAFRIGMVATGGTISMRKGQEGSAPAPVLSGTHLVAMLEDGAHVEGTEVTVYEPHSIASEDLSFSLLTNLVEEIRQALAENDAVIVTHGTDTMEDAAYFVAEALGNPEVVFTGSMLPSDHPEYDGVHNLTIAFTAARSGEQLGTVLAMYRDCLPAWSAVKRDSAAIDAFDVREGRPVGRVIDGEFERITQRPQANWIGEFVPLDDRDPIVPILTVGVGTSPDALERMTSVAKGIVIESTGSGSVPSSMRQAIIETAEKIPVVITTRCAIGPTLLHEVYPNKWDDLIESGVKFENRLDSYKARTRMILAISTGREYQPFRVTPI